MTRTYTRKVGARRYCDYSEDTLNNCLQAVLNGELTQRNAAIQFNIPRRTIINKIKNLKHPDVSVKKQKSLPGKPKIFNDEEEAAFVRCITKCSDFGFPLDHFEVRMIVKAYLDKCGRTVQIFKNNVPGREWVLSFLKRHPTLTGARFAANIKRSRAGITKDTLKEYIDNLGTVIKGIPAENIWNYDESNLTDDPGRKKVIIKRGSKYPERICNTTKTSISVMFCGNAAGESLPPFVVYKSTKLWDTWTENGPPGARYCNSQSGWFDTASFDEWFESLLLPRLKKLAGKKVMIGDNLSTHLSESVITLCHKNDIHFICLPANSTHLTQPLDVAFFAPLKRAWRKILTDWKESGGFKNATLQKQDFPPLLKQLLDYIEPNSKSNLISGFRTCGICPLSLDELLKKIPTAASCDGEDVENSFLKLLEEKRAKWTQPSSRGKRKQISIPAGKSVGPEHFLKEGEPSTSTGTITMTCTGKIKASSKCAATKITKVQTSSARRRLKLQKTIKNLQFCLKKKQITAWMKVIFIMTYMNKFLTMTEKKLKKKSLMTC